MDLQPKLLPRKRSLQTATCSAVASYALSRVSYFVISQNSVLASDRHLYGFEGLAARRPSQLSIHTAPSVQQTRRPHGCKEERQEQPRFQQITRLPDPRTHPDTPPPTFDPISRPAHQWQVFFWQHPVFGLQAQEQEISSSLVTLVEHYECR